MKKLLTSAALALTLTAADFLRRKLGLPRTGRKRPNLL